MGLTAKIRDAVQPRACYMRMPSERDSYQPQRGSHYDRVAAIKKDTFERMLPRDTSTNESLHLNMPWTHEPSRPLTPPQPRRRVFGCVIL